MPKVKENIFCHWKLF